jgi:T5SS/PEP-CTERM-associated repeat protein
VPNPGTSVYLPGDLNNLEIGRSITGAATSGTVTVTGAGSQLLMTGAADAFMQVGRGANGTGTLNILSGGQTRSSAVFIGTESGTGLLTMNGGHMVLDGTLNGGPSAGNGAGLGVGRGGGTGVANLSGGSTISISSASGSSVSIGGSGVAPGGTGTMNLSGGSTMTVNSANGLIGIGRVASASQAGVGTLTLTGAGTSAAAIGTGARVLLASGTNTVGTAIVGAGASLSATSLIGVAHDGTASTGGIGTLVVNGTANATNLVIGTTGLLSGTGLINADVTNHGTIKPGSSPGRLTINGAFDSSDGRIELEVQSLGGGLFSYDEIVFGDPSRVTMGLASIDFVFLGETDPTAFLTAGLFDLSTFFKQLDASGDVVDLDDSYRSLFNSARFGASAERYRISDFVFDPVRGASFTSAAIPLPPSLALVLLGLMAMAGVRVRRQAVH